MNKYKVVVDISGKLKFTDSLLYEIEAESEEEARHKARKEAQAKFEIGGEPNRLFEYDLENISLKTSLITEDDEETDPFFNDIKDLIPYMTSELLREFIKLKGNPESLGKPWI